MPCSSRNNRAALGALAGLMAAGAVLAQQTEVPFGGLDHDSSLPVEITADVLELDQASGTAVFSGSVTVGQGDLRLTADTLTALYAENSGSVDRMEAAGNVTLVSGAEAAEAERAVYDVATGTIRMEGEVLLTQGPNALSSETLRIDLTRGTGLLEGRVRTILVPGSDR